MRGQGGRYYGFHMAITGWSRGIWAQMVHAETGDLIAVMQTKLLATGNRGPEAHVWSRSAEVEGEATNPAIMIADAVGVPVYTVHTSSEKTHEAIRRWKQAGTRVWGEPMIQHLLLDDSKYADPDRSHAAQRVMQVRAMIRVAGNGAFCVVPADPVASIQGLAEDWVQTHYFRFAGGMLRVNVAYGFSAKIPVLVLTPMRGADHLILTSGESLEPSRDGAGHRRQSWRTVCFAPNS